MFQCMGACLFHFVMKTFFVDIFQQTEFELSAGYLIIVVGFVFLFHWPSLGMEKMQMSKATAGTVSLKPKQTWHIQANNLAKPCLISKQVLSSRHVGNVAVQISCMKKKAKQKSNADEASTPKFIPLKKPNTLENTKTNEAQKQRQIMCVYVFLIPRRG